MPSTFLLELKQRLKQNADPNFQAFVTKLVPNANDILGIKTPVLRKLAKEIHAAHLTENFLQIKTFQYFEEYLLKGILIGLLQKPPQEILKYIQNFLSEINNWAVCDSFCSALKFTKNNLVLVWEFIQPYFQSPKEFELRFGYVMLLNYYIKEAYIDRVFNIIDGFRNEQYYAKMAVAWALSICHIKYPEKTIAYLKQSKLDPWIFNKSIQKICESKRITAQIKTILKNLKK